MIFRNFVQVLDNNINNLPRRLKGRSLTATFILSVDMFLDFFVSNQGNVTRRVYTIITLLFLYLPMLLSIFEHSKSQDNTYHNT